ncbi:MAG: LLM class flavin-dependent oxidoreductase [Alphaproteobacteria bacterium]
MMELGVLDQSPIAAGRTPADAVAETLSLAQTAEDLGYTRYWVAEHHNTAAFAGSCPEILMTRIASLTSWIKVGSAGVLLQHYAPLKIAEQFRMLETLFPGRIELGLGRAPGADPRTAAALQPGPKAFGPEVYPQKVDLLARLLDDARGIEDAIDGDHPYRGIRAQPFGNGCPALWMLGSSPSGAVMAAALGLPFAYAHFISGDDGETGLSGPDILGAYRRRFTPHHALAQPDAALAVSVICAPTLEEAERLALTRQVWAVQLLTGQHALFLSPEDAAAVSLTDQQKALLPLAGRRCIVGDPAAAGDALRNLAERYGTTRLVVHSFIHDPEARERSYALLADALL